MADYDDIVRPALRVGVAIHHDGCAFMYRVYGRSLQNKATNTSTPSTHPPVLHFSLHVHLLLHTMPRITIDRQNVNPLWWTGEKQAHRKNLLVRIPPISEGVKAVIASKLSKKEPRLVQKSDLDAAQHTAQIAREKLQHIQSTLNSCLQEREHALSDVTDVRAKQLQHALKELDEQMRNEFEEEMVTKEQECQVICEEMELKMLATIKKKQREIDERFKQQLVEEEQANQEDIEPPTKRTKIDGDDEPPMKADASETEAVLEEPVRDSAKIEERKREIEVRWRKKGERSHTS
jgi:hypothetical protein